MGKKVIKPAPASLKQAATPSPKKPPVASKAGPEKGVKAEKTQRQAMPAKKERPVSESVELVEHKKASPVAEPIEQVTKSAPSEFNDRGPTQLSISRRVRERFRKTCFLAHATMSDVVEKMMDEYASTYGY